MKLLIIVLSLLSERYLVHRVSLNRFYWFADYLSAIDQRVPAKGLFTQPVLMLMIIVSPPLLITILSLLIGQSFFFGFLGLILHFVIFYYCLGPSNSFYPVTPPEVDNSEHEVLSKHYFTEVNSQLFATIFWYLILGPIAVLGYRLIFLCQEYLPVSTLARQITAVLLWIPARITVILYLLVGNFQQGFNYFLQYFFTSPKYNDELLAQGGILAVQTNKNNPVLLTQAQTLVEHALIVYLVLIAFFTVVAWL